MFFLLLLVLLLLLTVAYGAMFGAPYLPTQKEQIEHAFKLLDLEKDDTVVDLGCGDGRFLLAAKDRGLKAVGYEINPLLYLIARLRTYKYKDRIRVIFSNVGNLHFSKDIDGIYLFLMTKKLSKLEVNLRGSGIKVVSYAYRFKEKKAIKSEKGLILYQF